MRAEQIEIREATCGACGTTLRLDYACDGDSRDRDGWGDRCLILHCDDETKAFLDRCMDKSWKTRLRVLFQHHARSILRRYISLTDANGMVGAGRMHLVSSEQARLLLSRSDERAKGCLLDVGAGDGGITESFSRYFRHTVATEVSTSMLRRLTKRGYLVIKQDPGSCDLHNVLDVARKNGIQLKGDRWFDTILLLNVLDRCDKPRTLLASIRDLLLPNDGLFILAVVLPFRPFVEVGLKRSAPTEMLQLPLNCSWTEGVHLMIHKILLPAGFSVISVSKAPYLSEGDLHHPVYSLDDAIFVLQRAV